ncbi:L-idonate 5-dehydrogenase [Xylanimonas ulmi]|nr:zinc-binding dehydrogenase [Xylanibacterium ulmi]
MRAITVHGAEDLRLEFRSEPVPGPDEVLIRVGYAGVCGSDLHYYRSGRVGAFEVREPLVVGHEISGRVAVDAPGLPAGTPVTVHPATPGAPQPGIERRPNIWPGSRYLGSAATTPHTQGAMSDLAVVRADQIRVLPDDLPLRRAVLAEPLAVGLHAIARADGVVGKRVLVSGAGPIGLLAAGAAHASGAASVTVSDLHAAPLEIARRLGAADVVRVGAQEAPAEAFDVVLECAGAPAAVDAAIRATRRGGVVVLLGMLPGDARPYTLVDVVTREIDVRGSFRFDHELDDAVAMLATTPALGHVVTDVFGPRDALAAFDRAADPRTSSKVVIEFAGESVDAAPAAGVQG